MKQSKVGDMVDEYFDMKPIKTRVVSESPRTPDALNWTVFHEDTVPHKKTLLFETEKLGGGVAYHTGVFSLNGHGQPFGIVGGRFYFDRKILRYADISDLLP